MTIIGTVCNHFDSVAIIGTVWQSLGQCDNHWDSVTNHWDSLANNWDTLVQCDNHWYSVTIIGTVCNHWDSAQSLR